MKRRGEKKKKRFRSFSHFAFSLSFNLILAFRFVGGAKSHYKQVIEDCMTTLNIHLILILIFWKGTTVQTEILRPSNVTK